MVDCWSPAAPSTTPRNVIVERTSISTITVSWIPLNLVEAQGFIGSYTVYYDLVTSRKRQPSGGMKTVPGNESTTTIDGLENTDYNVRVVANTVVGEGPVSEPVTAAAPCELMFYLGNSLLQCKIYTHVSKTGKLLTYFPTATLFQIQLTGIPNCPGWVVSIVRCTGECVSEYL